MDTDDLTKNPMLQQQIPINSKQHCGNAHPELSEQKDIHSCIFWIFRNQLMCLGDLKGITKQESAIRDRQIRKIHVVAVTLTIT
jgi:hypothetical protein